MPIYPLPQFEADLAELTEEDRKAYEALKAPKTLVVRFGSMMLVGEFPYDGSAKPGCGSKVVVRTHRGTELGEMLTSTCANSGCSKSVSRKELLGYIQNSGGRDYPFIQDGRVVRIATPEDLDRQAKLEQSRHGLKLEARAVAERIHVTAKIVDAEPILGNEVLTFFYLSEERLDLRDLHRELSNHFRMRIDLRQVGARDEARLTADYEKCGQYCCCKNFLKVLKPVSMKSAKVQKATLDPMKISGRCGRLMCCLRYEDATYEELKAKLPRKKSRVGTPEGEGTVLDGQILTQLVLVELDDLGPDGKIRQIAVPVEELGTAINLKAPVRELPPERPRGPKGPGGPPPQRPQMSRPARPVEVRPVERPQPDAEDARPTETPAPKPEAADRQPPQSGERREFRSVRGPNRPVSGPKPQMGKPPQQGPRAQDPRQGDQAPAPRPGNPAGGPGGTPSGGPPRRQRDSVDDIMAALDDADGLGSRGRPPQGGKPPRRPGPDRRDQRPNRPDKGPPGPRPPESDGPAGV